MKKFVMNYFNKLIINYVVFQKFVLPISRIKKTIFNSTFAFEKRTHYELPFGHDQKTLFALTRSGPAPPCLQHQKQNGENASRCQ
jgi:hypothetical protein